MMILTQLQNSLKANPLIPTNELFSVTTSKLGDFMLTYWEEALAADPAFAQQVEKITTNGGRAAYVMRDPSFNKINKKEVEKEMALVEKFKATQKTAYDIGKIRFEQFLTATYGPSSIAFVERLSYLHCSMYTGYGVPMKGTDVTAFKDFLAAAHYSSSDVETLFAQFKKYAESTPSQQKPVAASAAADARDDSKKDFKHS